MLLHSGRCSVLRLSEDSLNEPTVDGILLLTTCIDCLCLTLTKTTEYMNSLCDLICRYSFQVGK